MKSIAQGGIVRALIALGLVSYQAAPALAVGKVAAPATQLQWVTQLIVKEKSSGLKPQSGGTDGTAGRPDVATVQRWSAAAQLQVTYKRAMSGGAHVVTLPNVMSFADAQTVAHRMEASGQFEYVSPDRIMRPTAVASDPQFVSQWNLWPSTTVANGPATTAVGGANVTSAWDNSKGVNSVYVAVIDTGLLANHEDLAGAKIRPGYDFISNNVYSGTPDPTTHIAVPPGFVENDPSDTPAGRDNNPSDPGNWVTTADAANYPTYCGSTARNSSWHGTFVTGQIVAQHNSLGIAGIAPNVTIQMARALGKCGGVASDVIDALAWVTGDSTVLDANNTPLPVNSPIAKVVNMSLGGAGPCLAAEQAVITAARARGATIVVATGNDGAGTIGAPANCNGVIAVTAHTMEGDSADYANVGTGTTISAPGGGSGTIVPGSGNPITSLSNTGMQGPAADTYAMKIGTSMATPHVAGVAALMLSVNNRLTPDQISTILQQTARPFPAGTYCASQSGLCGSGMLDAGAAVTVAKGNPSVHASASASTVVANNAVTLTASGNAGVFNTISSVQWAQTSGPSVTLATAGPDSNGNYTATFTPSATGAYAFTVTLTSNTGATATDTANVTVTPAATSASTTSSGSSNGGSGGGGALPLWLAGLLLASGGIGIGRRRAR
jgi:serine protease